MRWSVMVLLLALALGGCTIEVVSSDPASSGRNAGQPPAEPTSGRAPDTNVDAAPGTDDAETRTDDETQAVRTVNTFWERWFAERDRRYVPPTVEGGYVGANGPSCAGQPSVPGNAFYCPSGNFLAWDENLMRAGYTQIGDAWVWLVIAHEWAHAIQAQLPDRYIAQAVELQADCLAGAALQGASDAGLVRIEPGDAEEISQTLQAVADDYAWTDESSHGNARQRTSAFRTGVADGVDACLGG